MGYSGHSVDASDTASDAFFNAVKAMTESLSKELNKKSNQFNTPGYVNVAMIIDEYLIPGNFAESGYSPLTEVAVIAKAKLTERLEQAKVATGWRDQESKKEHIDSYIRLLVSLDLFINKGLEMERL